jgi:hypothetical protein
MAQLLAYAMWLLLQGRRRRWLAAAGWRCKSLLACSTPQVPEAATNGKERDWRMCSALKLRTHCWTTCCFRLRTLP